MSATKAPAKPIKRARKLVSTRPLLAVDTALLAFKETRAKRADVETREYLDVLARAVFAASASTPPVNEDPVEAMLSDRSCDRIACASLLRLLVLDHKPFEVDRRLRGSTALFDRMLAKSLYEDIDLSTNDQTFEKRDRLRTHIEDKEKTIVEHVRSLGSLDAMDSFRSWFGKFFADRATGAFVLPFLPEGITRQTFDELLGPAQGMADCSDVSLLDRAEMVEARCRALTEQAEGLGTYYCQTVLLDLATTLQRLTRERVAYAGFSDPAKLAVTLRPKRYPLRHPGASVTVRLDLTNEGPGHAQEVTVEIEGGGVIEYDETVKVVGSLGPGSRLVHFHGTVMETSGGESGTGSDVLGIEVRWRNPDRSDGKLGGIVETLEEQPGNVPWEELEFEEPYPLEPVTDPTRFVGRAAAVQDLVKVVLQSGNARIEGEKRVGKTSLAYAVSATAEEQRPGEYVFIQLESGDFNAHTPEETVARLGQMIAERVRKSDKRLGGLPMPDLTPGLTTLTELFAEARDLAPDRSFVITLDEFDALPHNALYEHEPVGDAFFQTLRSLGGKSNIAFILVGGERMKWVIGVHGQTLNKFKLVPLDYFAEDQMTDYAELVQAPVAGWLLFADGAVDALYRATAGNPWMTKLLLGQLFERQVERRDHEVQADDVADAIADALPKFDVSSFQHFWDDAIRGDVEDREHVSSMRRRVFLALARRFRATDAATEDNVVTEARNFSVDEPTAREVIRGLLDRSIIRSDENGELVCRVPLFERWLAKYGAQKIILGTGDDDTLINRQRAIEEMRPSYEELGDLAKRWRSYRGEDLHAEQIGGWLDQFGGPEEQRLMMHILEGLRFYTRPKMDGLMRDLHQYVLRELASQGYEYEFSGQQRNRDDFLVCGLEGGGSGAAHLLKRYRDENGIYSDCAVDAGRVRTIMDAGKHPIRAVLVLDDFVGTGGTASRRLQELYELWTAAGDWPADVDVFFLVTSGFDQGIKQVEKGVKSLGWPLTIRVEDVLADEDRCFHPDSRFFPDANARGQAQALCSQFGSMLSPKTPFGFGHSEAAVCFEYRCPNNSLPVLWNDRPGWKPLFPRH